MPNSKYGAVCLLIITHSRSPTNSYSKLKSRTLKRLFFPPNHTAKRHLKATLYTPGPPLPIYLYPKVQTPSRSSA